jgi:hypothetical protein
LPPKPKIRPTLKVREKLGIKSKFGLKDQTKSASGAGVKKGKVKVTTKLTGPVEEIKNLTLVDFRRLDSDPKKAAENIYNKILLLEEQSFTKKVQAILGWRESEVFKIYTEIAHESMDQKRSMAEVIEERKSAGKPTLSLAEFEAIMDLNQKLRF